MSTILDVSVILHIHTILVSGSAVRPIIILMAFMFYGQILMREEGLHYPNFSAESLGTRLVTIKLPTYDVRSRCKEP